MRIICDCDEVLADMMPELIREYNEKYQSDLVIDDIVLWGLPEDMKDIFRRDNFFFTLRPICGAIEGIRQLIEWGHDVIVATNHSNGALIASDKVDWIKHHLPELSNNMMIGGRKDILQGDIIIDDNADYLINSPCPIKICMDRPWNRNIDMLERYKYTYEVGSGDLRLDVTNYDYYRVGNWQEILALFAGGAFKVW